jgi:hypothetical protein
LLSLSAPLDVHGNNACTGLIDGQEKYQFPLPASSMSRSGLPKAAERRTVARVEVEASIETIANKTNGSDNDVIEATRGHSIRG